MARKLGTNAKGFLVLCICKELPPWCPQRSVRCVRCAHRCILDPFRRSLVDHDMCTKVLVLARY